MTTGGTDSFDVAVIGGGPAGLASALALAQAGAGVALVAPDGPVDDWRTTALLGTSADILGKLGIWDKVLGTGAPLRTMRLVDATHRLIRAPEVAFHAVEIGREAFGCNIRNRDLVGLLGAAVEGNARITRFSSTASSISSDERGVTVTTASGDSLVARLLVGADGRKSPSREAAGLKVRSWSYPQEALVVNLAHTGTHNDTSTEFHTETGPFTLVPLGPRLSSLVCMERPAEAARLEALDDAALALECERRAGSLLGRFTVASPRQRWPMSGFKAVTLADRRTALVGEAAHGFPPIGAQGFNLTLRDVADLAEVVGRTLRQGEDVGAEATLARYRRARSTDVSARVIGVDLLNRSLLSSLLPVQFARMAGLELARSLPPLRRLMMKQGLTAVRLG